jgi:hypothetical protein
MLSTFTYREIVNNEVWAPHLDEVRRFSAYLENTEGMTFRVSGTFEDDGEDCIVTRELPYIHRWTPIYKKMVIAKFYKLEDYARSLGVTSLTMLTLTTFHAVDQFGRRVDTNDVTIPESFALLKQGWDKLRNAINKRGFQYVWIMEPHRSGYPHLHVAIFGDVPLNDQIRIKHLWEKYGCGSYEHGAKFTAPKGGNVKSLRNYLIKYMVKGLRDAKVKWTTAQLVFNALVKEYGWRLWGSTRDLTIAMKKDGPITSGVTWLLTETKKSWCSGFRETWRKKQEIKLFRTPLLEHTIAARVAGTEKVNPI